MSDILIRGIKMPTRCYTCFCADLEFYDCNLMPGTRIEQYKRLDACPLVPIQKHGRLIDADALPFEKCEYADGSPVLLIEKRDVDSAPTIIPAEDGET